MASERLLVLRDLAARIESLSLGHPVRIAIDGRTASGKTTLADELAAVVRTEGKEVIRTSIDGFHRAKAERYARGRYSAEGYYYDARDLPAVMSLLLAPLGPDGGRAYRTASFDLENDRPAQQERKLASADAVLIVDGTFLQRPELSGGWDVTIFVETSEQIAERRGVSRDAGHLGGADAAQKLYADRYRGAFNIYQGLCAPDVTADAVVGNDDWERPQLRIRADGRLSSRQSD
jgi:uridine kinase